MPHAPELWGNFGSLCIFPRARPKNILNILESTLQTQFYVPERCVIDPKYLHIILKHAVDIETLLLIRYNHIFDRRVH